MPMTLNVNAGTRKYKFPPVDKTSLAIVKKRKTANVWALEKKILTPAAVMKLMTRDQCRAARTLLHMTQPQLAERAGCSLTTLVNYELDRRYVTDEMIQSIQRVLEKAGAIFINGNGVRLRRDRQK